MSRLLRPTTEMEQSFASYLALGYSPTESARRAGYSDPSGEIDRLLSRRAVVDVVLTKLQGLAVRWGALAEAAKKALYANLTAEGVAPTDRNAAAKIVLDILRRTSDGDRALADVAETEDKAETNVALAQRILGPGTSTEQ